MNGQARVVTDEGPPPCMIYVDRDGSWFHKGNPIVHRGVLRLFYESLCRDEQGNYVLRLEDQVCRLEVEDTPFVVVGLDFVPAGRDGKEFFILHLIDETQERLDPNTLCVGAQNVLYCKVRNGTFPARFSRAGYYQMAKYIEQSSQTGGFFLPLNGTQYYIRQPCEGME
jgi:hypothetical protein